MAEFVTVSEQVVEPGQNVLLISTDISCQCSCCRRCNNIMHRNGSGIVMLRGCSQNCATEYVVEFNANLAVPTGGTAGAIATAITLNGEALQESRAIVTPAAVEQYFPVTNRATIEVPRGCCYIVAIENVPAGVNGTVDQQAISLANGNLTITPAKR